MNVIELFKKFPDEESARKHFEKLRWGDSVQCPHCNSTDIHECKNHRPMPYRCRKCRKHFSVRTGTVLEESRLPLQKWILAVYMIALSRKGISSVQMAKQLGVTQKTAWFLAQRIREAWKFNHDDDKLRGEVEVDETFIGGKEKNKHASKKRNQGRGSSGKEIVVGVIQRNGKIVAEHVKSVSSKTLHGFITRHVEAGSTVYTDTFKSYHGLDKRYSHESVNHSGGEYVRGNIHTNRIESFWAVLKRGYYGVFHFISPKHLQRYLCEFTYRTNTAKYDVLNFIDETFQRMSGKHLSYQQLTK